MWLIVSSVWAAEQSDLQLEIPPRQLGASAGSNIVEKIKSLELAEREQVILDEINKGNIPDFLRDLVTIEYCDLIAGEMYDITFFCMPDYLAIGSDHDYFLMPMTPMLAQKVVDEWGGIMPTRKMVNLIWEAAELKLTPQPIPPSPAMVTVEVFRKHHAIVDEARKECSIDYPPGVLVAGHKKDVILSNRVSNKPDKVVIYGWHYPSGKAIQPLYSGHVNWYADYSHGIRVLLNICVINGETREISEVLKDPVLYQLFSDEEGEMKTTRYNTSQSNYPE